MSTGMPSLAAASGGRYEMLRRLAVGGMGEIFLARERGRLGFSRLVVIKKMLPDLAEQPGYLDMFVDEARIVGHLGHPNICQILELGEDEGLPFLALEYVRGENLTGIYNRAHKVGVAVPRWFPLRVIADVAWALDFVHDAQDSDGRALHIVHRDISPHNVMVSFRGDVKLMDFGIARADNRSHRTAANQIKGKLAYMAPEQLRNQTLDRRVDVFALGVMLWELTLGRRLFAGGSEVETFQNAMRCEVPPPRSIEPGYPAALEAIVMQALCADRERRTATAAALGRALNEHLATQGTVERSDLAAIMTRLFPDAATTAEDVVVTASWLSSSELELDGDTDPRAQPGTLTASAPIAVPPAAAGPPPVTSPTVQLRGSARSPSDAPASDASPTSGLSPSPPIVVSPSPANPPPPPPIAAPRGRRRWIPAIGALAVVAGAVVAIGWPRGRTSDRAAVAHGDHEVDAAPGARAGPSVVPLSPPPDAAAGPPPAPPVRATASQRPPRAAGSGATPRDPAAGSSAAPRDPVAAAREPGIGSGVAPRDPDIGSAAAARRDPPVGAGAGPAAGAGSTPAPAAATGPGTLAVSSSPTGMVLIDGVRQKTTPFQTTLPAGEYQVQVELVEGAGTLRAKARVASGRKTKCRVADDLLSCAPPQSQP